MFEESSRSLIRRAREGSGKTQANAAGAVGLGRATLSIYESGRTIPSERKTWELMVGLALGDRAEREELPHLLLSFSLLGQRFFSYDGALLEFASLANAARAADALDDCGLERVVLVPAWGSMLEDVLEANVGRGGTSGNVIVFEELRYSLEEVVDQALRELIGQVQPWTEQAVATWQAATRLQAAK
jgi:transcriptional regulator with XRE-family HTH domain